jgi:protein-tyrosine phosphatase
VSTPDNYRDVGEALSLWIDPPPIPAGRLLRGGKLDFFTTPEDIGRPRTVLNLRRGPDPTHLAHPDARPRAGVDGTKLVHVPANDTVENYATSQKLVRRWVAEALAVLASPATAWPVYVHCTAGRDRTGVVIAAALGAIGVPREVVIEEYLLSEGAERALIVVALDGLGDVHEALGVDAKALRVALGAKS